MKSIVVSEELWGKIIKLFNEETKGQHGEVNEMFNQWLETYNMKYFDTGIKAYNKEQLTAFLLKL